MATTNPSSHQNGQRDSALPTTIEGATRRYLISYQKYFRGTQTDRDRLSGEFNTKINKLRRKAPKFYEEKLPKLINQAASALLACDVERAHGSNAFHVNHQNVLLILDELCRSQPSGEVDFQREKDLVKLREKFLKEQMSLRHRLLTLEATEFSINEVGIDEETTSYSRTFDELSKVKKELKAVSLKLAAMEALKLEEKITFDLKLPASTILKKLTQEQLNQFQEEVIKFLESHKGRRILDLINKVSIDTILDKIGINAKNCKEDFKDYSRDALDTVRKHFRNIDEKRWNDRLDDLLKIKHFRPKEGPILNDPDDVPEEVKQKFEESARLYSRQLAEQEDRLSKIPIEENTLEDDTEEIEDSNNEDDEINELMQHHDIFRRVKEEPRDDYDDEAPSDDEFTVGGGPSTSNRTRQNGGPNKRFKGQEDDDDCCIIINDEDETNDDATEDGNGTENGQACPEVARNGINAERSQLNGSPDISNDPSNEDEEGEEEDDIVPTFSDAQSKLDQIFNNLEDSDSDSDDGAEHTETQPPQQPAPKDPVEEDVEVLGTIAPDDKITYIDLE